MADWTKIKAEYLRGNTSCQKLADKYGVSYSSIRRRSEKEKWTELRAKSAQKSSEKIVESAAEHSVKIADTLYKTTEMLLAKIAEGMSNAPSLTPTDAANWANALERVKRTAGIRDTQTENDTGDNKIIVIPAREVAEEVSER